jgi:SAM-dependent methyltransferase
MARQTHAANTRDSAREIQDLYRSHPLSQRAILKRIISQRRTLAGITEMDLAEDPLTEITDQNHIGGVKFVKELARQAGIRKTTLVLDLGCGLGGSARYLAYLFGCRVHGIDLSRERYQEAQYLTELVGLDHRVTFQLGDVLNVKRPSRQFDVLWGQSAWVHIEDKQRLVSKWSKSLKHGGRIALEEAYVRRVPWQLKERRKLNQLADHWKSYLVTLDTWKDILSSQSFDIAYKADVSTELSKLYRKLIRLSRTRVTTRIPRSEKEAWQLAIELVAAGIVGYFRLVAKKSL